MTPREKRPSDANDVDGGARTCRRRAEAASERARAQSVRGGTSCASTSCGLYTLRGHVHELRDEVGDARRRRARCRWGRRVGRRRGSGDRVEGRADRRRAEDRCTISRFLRTRCAETTPRALLDDGALALRRRRVGERAVLRRRGGRGRNEDRDRQRRAEAAMQISCDAELCVHVLPAEVPCVLLRRRQPSVPERLSASLCSDVTSAFWRNGASDRWDSCRATLPPSRGIGCHGTLIRSAVAQPHTRARAPSSSTISAPSLSTR